MAQHQYKDHLKVRIQVWIRPSCLWTQIRVNIFSKKKFLTPFNSKEVKAKKKMLNQTLSELNKKLQGDVEKPPFNPGGGIFTGCIGCGEELRTKGISKGLCSSCQLRKGVSKKLDMYRQKAATKYLKITSKKSFLTQYHEKHDFEERLNLKMGYYRKACILYENGNSKEVSLFSPSL